VKVWELAMDVVIKYFELRCTEITVWSSTQSKVCYSPLTNSHALAHANVAVLTSGCWTRPQLLMLVLFFVAVANTAIGFSWHTCDH
jgi:hypothetical protein